VENVAKKVLSSIESEVIRFVAKLQAGRIKPAMK
jgi:hypothetical protein